MALHQYIGARYVPRFMGLYDAGTIYEGLDVVDNGLGTSYIARKPVPVGTPLTDTTYWAVYGASSGAIINLQNQIDQLVLDDQTINNRIDKIPTNKKMILIGDSFGYGVISAGTYTTGWIDYVKALFPDQVFTHDRGDTPIAGMPAFLGTLPFMDIFDWIMTNKINGVIDPEEITDVVILGGNNEPDSSQAAIESYIQGTFVPHVRAAVPNATISIGCIGLDSALLISKAAPAYKNACLRTGCRFISDTLNLGSQLQYDSGAGHWSSAGYAFYNPYIAHAVLFGFVNYQWFENHDLTLQSDVTIDGSGFSFKIGFVITNREVRARVYCTNGYSGWRLNYNKAAFTNGHAEAYAFNVVGNIYFPIASGNAVLENYLIHKTSGGIMGCGNNQMLKESGVWRLKMDAFVQGAAQPSDVCYVWCGALSNILLYQTY